MAKKDKDDMAEKTEEKPLKKVLNNIEELTALKNFLDNAKLSKDCVLSKEDLVYASDAAKRYASKLGKTIAATSGSFSLPKDVKFDKVS